MDSESRRARATTARLITAAALIVLLSAATLACVTSEDFSRCDGTMEITTIPGPELEIQWAPTGCGVYDLTIDQSGSIVWAVTMVELSNGIGSPVIYGTAPSGTQGSQVVPLTVGPYHVVLTRIDDQNRIHTAAQGTFSHQ